jgi:hypothetical protein
LEDAQAIEVCAFDCGNLAPNRAAHRRIGRRPIQGLFQILASPLDRHKQESPSDQQVVNQALTYVITQDLRGFSVHAFDVEPLPP